MARIKSYVATAALLASVGLAQNLPYGESNYSSQSQPDLTAQTLATINLSFPDCSSGPLSTYTICNLSASYMTRASSLIWLFTLEELINQTGNTAPGVPRLGLLNTRSGTKLCMDWIGPTLPWARKVVNSIGLLLSLCPFCQWHRGTEH